MCVCVSVTPSCLTLCDPMDSSPPGSSAHGILQPRILEWVVIPFFRGSSWPRDQTCISCIAGRFFTIWATREAWYAEYVMWNAGLSQARIMVAGRNINNLRYADDTTLMAESEEELKSLLTRMNEESEEVSLNLNIYKTKIMASGLNTSWKIDGEKVENSNKFYFPGLQNHCRQWLQP